MMYTSEECFWIKVNRPLCSELIFVDPFGSFGRVEEIQTFAHDSNVHGDFYYVPKVWFSQRIEALGIWNILDSCTKIYVIHRIEIPYCTIIQCIDEHDDIEKQEIIFKPLLRPIGLL